MSDIHNLQKRNDEKSSANVIYVTWRLTYTS